MHSHQPQQRRAQAQPSGRPDVVIGREVVDNQSYRQFGKIKRYTVGEHLGTGGFARCYRLTSLDSGHIYAGKFVPRSSLNAQNTPKLRQEIQIHHSLVLILELCSQKSLMDLWRARNGIFTETEAQFFLWQVVDAVHCMHSHGIIHRDLKIGNIFLTDGMRVKVGDFGLACRAELDQKRTTVCGTPNYIAPEILINKSHSFEVDIWALGIIAYTLLFGKPPFETLELSTTYNRIKNQEYSMPTDINVSEAARDLIRSLLTNAEDRLSLDEIRGHRFFTQSPFPYKLSTSIWKRAFPFPHHVLEPASSHVQPLFTPIDVHAPWPIENTPVDKPSEDQQPPESDTLPDPSSTICPESQDSIMGESQQHQSQQQPQQQQRQRQLITGQPPQQEERRGGIIRSRRAMETQQAPADSRAYHPHSQQQQSTTARGISTTHGTRATTMTAPPPPTTTTTTVSSLSRQRDPSQFDHAQQQQQQQGGNHPPQSTLSRHISTRQQHNNNNNVNNHGITAAAALVSARLPDTVMSHVNVWVCLYLDQTSRYGVAFTLSTGHMGVRFNDSTEMILHPDGHNIHYIDYNKPNDAATYAHLLKSDYPANGPPSQYKKKIQLLGYFVEQFRPHANSTDIFPGESGSELYVAKSPFNSLRPTETIMPHITSHHVASNEYIVFHLSTNVIQFIFIHKPLEVIIDKAHDLFMVTFPGRQRTAYRLSLVPRCDEQQIVDLYKYLSSKHPAGFSSPVVFSPLTAEPSPLPPHLAQQQVQQPVQHQQPVQQQQHQQQVAPSRATLTSEQRRAQQLHEQAQHHAHAQAYLSRPTATAPAQTQQVNTRRYPHASVAPSVQRREQQQQQQPQSLQSLSASHQQPTAAFSRRQQQQQPQHQPQQTQRPQLPSSMQHLSSSSAPTTQNTALSRAHRALADSGISQIKPNENIISGSINTGSSAVYSGIVPLSSATATVPPPRSK